MISIYVFMTASVWTTACSLFVFVPRLVASLKLCQAQYELLLLVYLLFFPQEHFLLEHVHRRRLWNFTDGPQSGGRSLHGHVLRHFLCLTWFRLLLSVVHPLCLFHKRIFCLSLMRLLPSRLWPYNQSISNGHDGVPIPGTSVKIGWIVHFLPLGQNVKLPNKDTFKIKMESHAQTEYRMPPFHVHQSHQSLSRLCIADLQLQSRDGCLSFLRD